MIRRRGKLTRTLLILGSAFPTIADGVRGLWRSEAGRKWLVPLLVFLCVTGLVLVVAASVLHAPRDSAIGLGILAVGLVVYVFWRWIKSNLSRARAAGGR